MTLDGPDPALSLPWRRTWLPLAVAGVVVIGLLTVLLLRADPLTCAEKVPARSPLLSPAKMIEQPDPRLDTLVSAVNNWPAPFGPVQAGVGYDYDQWLHLYGLADGMLTLTKNNARMTLVDDTSTKARWSLLPAAKRTAWDASADAFLLLDLVKGQPTRVGSYVLSSGEEQWCREIDAPHADGQPVATTVLEGGDVLVALPKGTRLLTTRLAGKDGRTAWSRPLAGVGRGDYLGPLDDERFVLGGVEEFRLAEPAGGSGASDVSAFRNADGARSWTFRAPTGTVTHVVGVNDDSALLVSVAAGRSTLKALDPDGRELWTIDPRDNAIESTLRGSVVLMRSKAGLDGYDAGSGKPLWHTDIPTEKTYFPYGFTLSQMPSLDATHVLMPTTESLRILDVTTGVSTSYPLPTDGINTTYWPYQLAVTPGSIAVVTNTGGVVAARE